MEKEIVDACPECGGTGVIMSIENGEKFFVKCCLCGHESSPSDTMHDAVCKWNGVSNDCRSEMLEDIVKLIKCLDIVLDDMSDRGCDPDEEANDFLEKMKVKYNAEMQKGTVR